MLSGYLNLRAGKMSTVNKMKVEVWSDVMCPFCYIGKRNYETAVAQFAGKDDIELIWKSYQLDPTLPTEGAKDLDVYEYLATRKGINRSQVQAMHAQVTEMAKNAGLEYRLDKSVMANSFKAHRVIALAKEKGLGDLAEERLFHATFMAGKDFGDTEILKEIGAEIGLTADEVDEALTNDTYAYQVTSDINEAREIGVTGVPFFVVDRKYAVSGAQAPQSFLQTLEKAHEEWQKTTS
jgi:predicted DsbA family dithiol-disulfide isomerase